MVGRVWPRHSHRGRPLNSVVRLQMNIVRALSVVAVVGGLGSGLGALESAEAARPPIEWNDIAFVLVGSIIGVAFVVGIQVAMKKQAAARIFSWFFGIVGIYIAVSGLVAFGIAAYRGGIAPSSLLILSMGIGTIIGALIAGRIHRAAFAT